MSRVDTDRSREVERSAQEQIKKQDDEKRRRDADGFKRMMAQKQSTEQREGVARQQALVGQRHAGSRLMAKHGIQSQNFASILNKNLDQTQQHNRVEGKQQRQEENDANALRKEHRQADNREDAAVYHRVEGTGDGGGAGAGDLGGDASPESGGLAAGVEGMETVASVAGPSAVRGGALPETALREIVEKVFVGKNIKGLSEFHIEFKGSHLEGLRVQISTENDGTVRARFSTDDVNMNRLLKSSEGQLARAFDARGLRVALEVESR